MKKRFILPITIFSLLLSFGLSACGGSQQGGDGSSGGAQASGSASSAQQEKITITAEGGKTALLKGESVQLTPSVEGVLPPSAVIVIFSCCAEDADPDA